jgi:hypothetical protein
MPKGDICQNYYVWESSNVDELQKRAGLFNHALVVALPHCWLAVFTGAGLVGGGRPFNDRLKGSISISKEKPESRRRVNVQPLPKLPLPTLPCRTPLVGWHAQKSVGREGVTTCFMSSLTVLFQ